LDGSSQQEHEDAYLEETQELLHQGHNSGSLGGDVDGEIALLEAQLEIKRLEAKLLLLKKSKGGVAGGGNSGSGPRMA
jgi:hypothetical protein